jgi:hypothetical protein
VHESVKRSVGGDSTRDWSMSGVVDDGRWKDEMEFDGRVMSKWKSTGRPLGSREEVEACARDVGCSSVFLED